MLAALALATVYNLPLWQKLFNLPGVTITGNAGFLFGMLVILTSIFFIFFSLVSYRYLLKTVIAVVIVLAATISFSSMRYVRYGHRLQHDRQHPRNRHQGGR